MVIFTDNQDPSTSVHFSKTVCDHFTRNVQLKSGSLEAGGQLFGRLETGGVFIDEATGPRRSDRRTRFSYQPDRGVEQNEIAEMFLLGLHYVGDWHTHPSDRPRPSSEDVSSIRSIVDRSRHEHVGFLLVIVGTARFEQGGLWVSIEDGNFGRRLNPSEFP